MKERKVGIFVEKEKPAGWIARTAREFAGWPMEMEWKEVDVAEACIRDERIMPDGRPAHAWWCEIESLRKELKQLQTAEGRIHQEFIALGIAKWAMMQEAFSFDTLIRFRPSIIASADEISRNPGKFCSLERP
jgi:hypothetical protein